MKVAEFQADLDRRLRKELFSLAEEVGRTPEQVIDCAIDALRDMRFLRGGSVAISSGHSEEPKA